MIRQTLRSYLSGLTLFILLWVSPALAFFDNETKVTPEGNEVRIKADGITPKASYFAYTTEGTKVVFFAVRDPQNGIRIALDAFDACWPAKKGYTQEKDIFVCNNCKMQFHVTRIGLRKGGCNPHPIPFTERDGMLIIPLDALNAGISYFK